MIGIDTNILIRYLTKDDLEQWELAVHIIQNNQPCFVSNIVLCETVWVLKRQPYQFNKEQILSVLEMMLHSAFEFENRSILYQAIQRTRQGGADFSDYLIGAIATHAGCDQTVTFDRKLRREKGFRYLE
ncbi:PilT protein domain protein [Gloeocapsa sp. PCC 7428]|uniref:PIN domain-containing protein n=1 Tax=Gloeocapsa sp. PCC 7428 TaxID=1173026 RepID=UPI0002A5ECCA|nr:type II toxin-antitoxin system VapC family toxin [Gloeocapsa sp. PCC 7428]AFZ29305.1 PilT protein domain protein [Gloeocapsa sp. PCC 7428]